MDEQPLIQITVDDVAQANRLSLSCPICASAVEDNVAEAALAPVLCVNCQTLYHHACWEQHGGKCAVLGCNHDECRPYGDQLGPRLRIRYSDLPKHAPRVPSPNGRLKRLKEQQRAGRNPGMWRALLGRLLRAFGWR